VSQKRIDGANAERGSRRAGGMASQTGRAFIGVRELLLHGEFARGERISELPLVARLGMSRTPIRLALERLAHIGLLDSVPSGGFVVREFTIADALDAIEVRGVLEGAAARLAAERLTIEGELQRLRHLSQQMEVLQRLTIDSFAQYMDLNEAFHAGIVELSRSAMLQRHLEQVNSLPFASPSAMVFPISFLPHSDETFAIAVEQHRGLVDAIGRRQGTRAESIAREHAYLARRVLESTLSDTDALSRVPGGALIKVRLSG
jgi:GntR family transcriptional regulator, vanillate catabolism transcriptional regulator